MSVMAGGPCPHVVGLGLLIVLAGNAWGQNPIFNNGPINVNNNNNDPTNQQASSNTYYFDRNSDCNKGTRNIYGTEATIYGHGTGTAQTGPESCTIKIKSEQQFSGTILQIEVRSMSIRDCDTYVSVYDGDGAQLLLNNYDCKSGNQVNRRTMKTSGNTATFVMTRRDTDQFNYNVQIIINPIRGGLVPGEENSWGDDFYFDKFEQKSIVGMIGGLYLVILIACSFCIGQKWRSYKGLTKSWETHQLAAMKTNAGFEGQSQTTGPTHAWSTAHSRPPPSQYSRTHTDAYSRKHGLESEDGESGVFRYDDDFQKRQLMNERSRGRSGPPTYASKNDSYMEPEDAEDTFTEKVITPRVHTRRNRGKNGRRPPSYEDATHSESEEESEEEESESEESTRKTRLSSEESDATSDCESDSESEEESDDNSRRGRGARGGRWKPKHDKRKKSKKASSRDSHDSRDSRDTRDSRSTAASRRHPPPGHPGPPPPMAYPAYPPGQFVPVMAGPPQFQPVQMMPAYPPQPYQGAPAQGPPTGPPIQPTDPPVYSYLVRRGYTPLDAQSQGSGLSQRSGAGRVEEPETRLSSGVEYMRR